ncbi:MAG: DUF2130 domain-containing protein, partial [Clostridia bacterium]|nr:DUF2130 domain-containing protein [Clostridia bacterium]
DRREKKCEYAVLVSMLESDSEVYNSGIVDVSYKYEKMYVIRPQFFMPLITILRNANTKVMGYKKELTETRNQNLDITHFEENLLEFKDKTIDHLQKVKDALTSSERQLRLANDKAQDLSIKKLTKNNPTMTELFEQVKNNG